MPTLSANPQPFLWLTTSCWSHQRQQWINISMEEVLIECHVLHRSCDVVLEASLRGGRPALVGRRHRVVHAFPGRHATAEGTLRQCHPPDAHDTPGCPMWQASTLTAFLPSCQGRTLYCIGFRQYGRDTRFPLYGIKKVLSYDTSHLVLCQQDDISKFLLVCFDKFNSTVG